MLTLPIKKKWFDMILSGEKKEEYREIKPYYISRFAKWWNMTRYVDDNVTVSAIAENKNLKTENIMFRNGYSKTSPSFIAKCTLSVGTGKEEWGAENDKHYFVLKIHDIN